MPKRVTITLDGQEYVVEEKRSRENAQWRQKLEEPFKELAQQLERAPAVELTKVTEIAQLVRGVGGTLLQSMDIVVALLIEYAPGLREAVKEAYDSEILEAFGKVLGLAYPFGGLIERLKTLGSKKERTKQS
jgi:hypothetical protein